MIPRGGALALLQHSILAAAAVSLAACATGSGINVAGSGGDPNFADETPADQSEAIEPIYLAASGNIMLPWRDAAALASPSLTSPGLDGTVAGLVGRSGPVAGVELQAGISPQGAATALGLSTPLATTGLQASLTPEATTAGVVLATPLTGVQAAASLTPQAVTASAGLATPVSSLQATAALSGQSSAVTASLSTPVVGVSAGLPLGGLGGVSPAVGSLAGPVVTTVANPNAVTGALLTNLSGAAMKMGPARPMTAPMVPSSQNLGAVLGLLKPPGA